LGVENKRGENIFTPLPILARLPAECCAIIAICYSIVVMKELREGTKNRTFFSSIAFRQHVGLENRTFLSKTRRYLNNTFINAENNLETKTRATACASILTRLIRRKCVTVRVITAKKSSKSLIKSIF
jgi:hypothetical protein